MNDSIEGIKFKRLNSLKKFPTSVVGFICHPPCCSLYESPSRSSALPLYPKCLKYWDWPLHYSLSLSEEKEAIDRWLLFRSFGDNCLTQFNRNGKCRDHLQATQWFRILQLIPPPLGPGLSPSNLLYMENFT